MAMRKRARDMPKISGQRPHNEVGILHIIVRKSAGNCQDIVHGANFRTMTGQRRIHIDMCTYTTEKGYMRSTRKTEIFPARGYFSGSVGSEADIAKFMLTVKGEDLIGDPRP
jgi:hypothetical protein